jgi:hypothetical protein
MFDSCKSNPKQCNKSTSNMQHGTQQQYQRPHELKPITVQLEETPRRSHNLQHIKTEGEVVLCLHTI